MLQNSNIRYGKTFHHIRQIAKKSLSAFYPLFKVFYTLPKVESVFETLERLADNPTLSLVRFGDGEILYINDKLNLPFQKYDDRLADCYKVLFKNNHDNLLVGLPIGYQDLNLIDADGQVFWRSQIVWNYPRFKNYLDIKTSYANASVTRLTFGFDEEYTLKGYQYWEKILTGEKALIIEGEKTRFGVGNDLLRNFKIVNRILAPKHDAFSKCDDIIEYVEININSNQTILIALGPAAKYIAFELFKKGYRVIDIGNLDIEYEWYLRGASKLRIAIPGKYTSEAIGGREVDDILDKSAKLKYENEVIAEFI